MSDEPAEPAEPVESVEWKRQLARGLRSARDLARLPLSEKEQAGIAAAASAFKVRAPASYVDLIDWADPRDPVRLQVIPAAEELQFDDRELGDPIGDLAHSPVPRLTHRYPDRVLLYPTYQCAVYCRHCFRKESLNDGDRGFAPGELELALRYIAEHPDICEVIVTGGDPWLLADRHLAWLRGQLAAIAHVRMIRWHTRIPVVLPGRITEGAIAALSAPEGRPMTCVVSHFNHPREITGPTADACRRLREAGFLLLNQTVLLRGINDSVEVLAALFRELVYTLGVKPYYLHHCDLVRGGSHFRTTIDEGLALLAALRGNISGVCLPTYVLDLPGGQGKVPLGPSQVEAREAHHWLFRNYRGELCPYEEVVSDSPGGP